MRSCAPFEQRVRLSFERYERRISGAENGVCLLYFDGPDGAVTCQVPLHRMKLAAGTLRNSVKPMRVRRGMSPHVPDSTIRWKQFLGSAACSPA